MGWKRSLLGDGDTKCIVCGAKLNGNHHCDPKYINNLEALRASVDTREPRRPAYTERLYDGLARIEEIDKMG